MEKKIFKYVGDLAEWLNEKYVDCTNFEEIVGNYVLEVEGMSCLHYKCYDGNYCLAFFKIENGEFADFKIIQIDACVFVQDYDEIVEQMKNVDFEDMIEDFNSYLYDNPLKNWENELIVFENWINQPKFANRVFRSYYIRLYEYYVLIRTVDDIAKKYANKKINAAVSSDVLVK